MAAPSCVTYQGVPCRHPVSMPDGTPAPSRTTIVCGVAPMKSSLGSAAEAGRVAKATCMLLLPVRPRFSQGLGGEYLQRGSSEGAFDDHREPLPANGLVQVADMLGVREVGDRAKGTDRMHACDHEEQPAVWALEPGEVGDVAAGCGVRVDR